MSNKSLEDSILNELQQLKGLAQRFKAAEEAYQNALEQQAQAQHPSKEVLVQELQQYVLNKSTHTKEEIKKEQIKWIENLESRLHQIIKGIEFKFASEGIPFENRQSLIQLKVKQEEDVQRIQQENQQLQQEITNLKRQAQRNTYLFVGLLALLIISLAGLSLFKLFTS